MTATNPLSDASTFAAAARPRRKREEIEELAATFVNSHLQRKVELPLAHAVRTPRVAAAACVTLLAIGALAWLLWPEPEVAGPGRDAAATSVEAAAWAQRLEVERERKRKELQSSRDYLNKIASADSALLADMTARAQTLESRATAAAPDVVSVEPTPATRVEVEPNRVPPPASAATRPDRIEPAEPTAQAREPVAAPAKTEAPAPQVVGQASSAAPRCSIHVSELSGSGTLTYADVARMKGARTDANGHVFTPPVAANGRTVVFEVMPSGCVRVARKR